MKSPAKPWRCDASIQAGGPSRAAQPPNTANITRPAQSPPASMRVFACSGQQAGWTSVLLGVLLPSQARLFVCMYIYGCMPCIFCLYVWKTVTT